MNRSICGCGRGSEFTWWTGRTFRKVVATHLSRTIDPIAAAKQLGHAQDSMTLRHYIEPDQVVPDYTSTLERLTG